MHVLFSTEIPEDDFLLLLDVLRAWHRERHPDHAPLRVSMRSPEMPPGTLSRLHEILEPDMWLELP